MNEGQMGVEMASTGVREVESEVVKGEKGTTPTDTKMEEIMKEEGMNATVQGEMTDADHGHGRQLRKDERTIGNVLRPEGRAQTAPLHVPSGPPASRPSASNRANTERQSIRNGAVRLDPARPAKTEEELEEMMREAMGFGDFKTTKDTKVPGNDKLYAVRKEKKTEYRQYMNRVGGFNRPLSPTREP
ncbi:MAG: hypothetical protein M1828_006088 [Chrysothrix sp. TS-e1954]|nr:MAG: hypothetical protein M1828_006088 [Chrysothrix sp. TS-e1954]